MVFWFWLIKTFKKPKCNINFFLSNFMHVSIFYSILSYNYNKKLINYDKNLIIFIKIAWCGHCKSLAPEYEKAAKKLKIADPVVILGHMDCTVEKTTCSEF